jgi:hypoxanthine phosphoribosyltransferase
MCPVYGVDNFIISFCMLQQFILVFNRLEDKYELTTELGRGEDGMSAEIDYTELRSYEKDKSTGDVKLVKDLSGSIMGRHVLVIEDILDTGVTFNYLQNHIEAKHPAP